LCELLEKCRLSPICLLQLFEVIRGGKVSDKDGNIMHQILLVVLSRNFSDPQIFAQVSMPLIRDPVFLNNYPDTLFVLVGSIVTVMRSTPGVFLGQNPYFCCEQCLRVHLYKLIDSALEANPMYENHALYEGLRNYLLQTILRIENEREAIRRQQQSEQRMRIVERIVQMYVKLITAKFLSGCCQIDNGSFECAICQETNDGCNMERPGLVFPCEPESKTGVRHIFCKPCLEKWVETLAKSGKTCEDFTCPCCRECMVASAASAASE
jgi:hypothetical protein